MARFPLKSQDSLIFEVCSRLVITPPWVMHMLQVLTYTQDGFDKHWQENRAQQGSGWHPNVRIEWLGFSLEKSGFSHLWGVQPSCYNSTMSDAYATVDIPKSLPIHRMALTSTGRKIEHNIKVVVDTQTYESNGSGSLEKSGFSHLWGVQPSCYNSTMSDAYATVDIPKSLPIHWMALTSTGRKIEHSKVVVDTQTYESNSRENL